MSSFFENIKDKLFGVAEQSSSSNPFTHELIKRSTAEQQSYQEWKATRREEQLAFLRDLYSDTPPAGSEGGQSTLAMYRLQGKASNGFILRFTDHFRTIEFQHLFDYFKERVKTQGYVPYVSDVKTIPRKKQVEMIERHHLKPNMRIPKQHKKFVQLYGNITIELKKFDHNPQLIKFVCSSYSDHNYNEALDFGALAEVVFT